MKRLVTLLIVMSTSLALVGCGLLPEDVQEVLSQELCEENPDHELCDLEHVEMVEEQVIVELVQSAMTKFNQDGCPDLVFAGNRTLSETCRNNLEELIPEGVTSFSPSSITVDDFEYTLFGDTNIDGVQLEITIKVVEIDGMIYIDDWKMTKTMIEMNEISEREAQLFLNHFFTDFGDSSISNDVFCSIYYDGEDNDCDGLRDSFFEYNQTITDVSLSNSKEYEFRGHVTVLKSPTNGGNTGETARVEVEVEVYRQEYGPIQIKRMKPDTSISQEQANSFFDVFFDVLTDSDVSDEDLYDMYFVRKQGDPDANRYDFGTEYSIVSDIQLVQVKEYEFRGHVTVLKAQGGTGEDMDMDVVLTMIPFGPILINNLLVHEPIDVMSLAEEKLSELLSELYDSTIKDEDLMYVVINLPDRTMYPEDEYEVHEILDIKQLSEMEVSITYKTRFKAGSELSGKVNIAFEEDDSGELDVIFTVVDPDDEDNDYTREDYVFLYFSQYFNADITDEDFYMEFNTGQYNSQLENRTMYVGSEYSIIVDGDGPVFDVGVVGMTPEGSLFSWTFEVRVNRWESKVQVDINNGRVRCPDGMCAADVVDRNEHNMIFNWFIDAYFDSTVSDEELNMMFFDNMMDQEFFDVRKEVQSQKNRYQVLEQGGPYNGAVFVYILDVQEPTYQSGAPTSVTIIKRIDKSSPLLFYLDPDDDGDSIPTDEEINARLSDFQEMSNHMSIAYTVMCQQFTFEHRVDACAMMISSKIATGYQLSSLVRLQQRPDLLLAEWENAVGETMTEWYRFYPFYSPEGVVLFELIPYTPNETDEVLAAFVPYVMALNNEQVSVNDACLYVDESSQDECVELKSFLLETRYMTELEYYYYDNDLMSHVVVFNVYNMQGEMIGQAEYDVRASEGNPLHQDRGNRAVNPMFVQSDT